METEGSAVVLFCELVSEMRLGCSCGKRQGSTGDMPRLCIRSNSRLTPPSKSVYDTNEFYADPDLIADARGSLSVWVI
jgi:hypothetical protein